MAERVGRPSASGSLGGKQDRFNRPTVREDHSIEGRYGTGDAIVLTEVRAELPDYDRR
jgi:hypothetical protein